MLVAISERTYTFRGPTSLGDHIKEIGERLAQLDGQDPYTADRIGREVAIRLVRRMRSDLPLDGTNQSALLRDIVEIFVESAGKVAADLEWDKLYAAERAAETDEDRARHENLRRQSFDAWDAP